MLRVKFSIVLMFLTIFQILEVKPKVIFPNVPDIIDRDSLLPQDFKVDDPLLEDQDPEVTPNLFQGDIALNNDIFNYWRVGLRWDVFPKRLWPNRTVPYAISPLYEPEDMITIYQAIQTISRITCLKFPKWNGSQKDFLLIWPIKYPKGCWSFVGKVGGPQILSLQPPDKSGPNCLGGEGRAIHEILHAIGIFHEQSRNDRDRFVKVIWDNIIPNYKGNFEKQSLDNTTYSFEYDYNSIMHYGSSYFSKQKGKSTLLAKMKDEKIGQRRALSQTDCLKINELYGCLDDVKLAKKYYTLCRILGI
ncbi:unnamed protein product [Chironomus riparius]|uniref:Metalloendopeptidase n=1 Tax=Chironomus riparius TaxID=315576 RepID=A0A9P0NF29_9DIPT|nr:unnamed protein product [Chironomus riparius]